MREGWEVKKLGDVCDVIAGQSPKSSFYNKDGNGLPFYQGKKLFSKKYILSPDTWTTKITKEAYKDDILMSVRAPVGPINFSTEKICIGRGLAAIRAKKETNKDYIFYFLLHHENQIVGNIGAVFNSINKNQISNLEIMIPENISEQTQIVKTLDLVFAKLDLAKANLEQNLRNAKELFESKLNEVFSQRGEGWVEERLGDVCKTGSGGTPLKSKKSYYDNGTIPWICSGEVKQGNIYKSVRLITEEGLNKSSAKLFPIDSVLVAMYGATAGEVGILRFESSTNQAVCAILPNDKLLPEFIYYSFLFRKDELIAKATGNAQPNISQIKIKNTMIPVIEESRQVEIIELLNNLQDNIKLLNSNYQQKLNNLEELKKSILERAFRGEL